MTQSKQEYVAAALRQQLTSLRQVMEDVETERMESENIGWRLRAIEMSLRRLREAA